MLIDFKDYKTLYVRSEKTADKKFTDGFKL